MIQGAEVGDWSVNEQLLPSSTPLADPFRADVLRRLQLIEQKLGLSSSSFSENMLKVGSSPFVSGDLGPGWNDTTGEDGQQAADLPDVRPALLTLVAWSSDKHNGGWSTRVVEALWLS